MRKLISVDKLHSLGWTHKVEIEDYDRYDVKKLLSDNRLLDEQIVEDVLFRRMKSPPRNIAVFELS